MEAAMDYDAMAAGLMQAIPFNSHMGLEIAELRAGVGIVKLPDRPEQRNHVGTQHAAALFAAGEAASGGAFVTVMADRLTDITPLAERADIEYQRIARGLIVATARFDGDVDEVRAALDREGKVRFSIPVELTDGQDRTVARMSVQWHVKRRD